MVFDDSVYFHFLYGVVGSKDSVACLPSKYRYRRREIMWMQPVQPARSGSAVGIAPEANTRRNPNKVGACVAVMLCDLSN